MDSTGTDVSASNEIVEIDVHLGSRKVGHPQHSPIGLDEENLRICADAISEMNCHSIG